MKAIDFLDQVTKFSQMAVAAEIKKQKILAGQPKNHCTVCGDKPAPGDAYCPKCQNENDKLLEELNK
jgi:uncharacterized OB-fold protein